MFTFFALATIHLLNEEFILFNKKMNNFKFLINIRWFFKGVAVIIGRCFSSLMANDNILTQPQIAKDLFFYGFLLEKLCDRPLEKKEAMQLTKKKF